jgi:DNA polymerase III epsilon subunit-like protein
MIVFDTETTGLPKPISVPLADQPQIIEFAAIKLNDKTLKELDRLEFLVNPGLPLPAEIVKITRLTDDDLRDKPFFPSYYQRLVDFFFAERFMVAHNLAFDRNLLSYELMRMDKLIQFPWPPRHICTVEQSYHLKNHRLKLTDLHIIATGKAFPEAHRAMHDVEALVRCVRWLRKEKAL